MYSHCTKEKTKELINYLLKVIQMKYNESKFEPSSNKLGT